MKVSLKVEDTHRQNKNPSLLLRSEIPVTIFTLPFLSAFSISDHPSDDLSLSLRTNFPSGPSLKLSYAPTSRAVATNSRAASPPLTLTLKSGVSLSGSPNNSPLIISANFSFNPLNSVNPNPTFSLQFKPRLGDFSLRKAIFSDSNHDPDVKSNGNGDLNSVGFLPLERPRVWKDLAMEVQDKESIFSGVLVMANTKMPVAKRMVVNLKWGVNFPADFGKQMPFMSVKKIGIERIDEVKEEKEKNVGESESEMLKGMFSWMKRELDVVQRENRELKHNLEELKQRNLMRSRGDGSQGEKIMPVAENSGGFDQWKSKKSASVENGKKEQRKVVNPVTDVESELQKAIKAASSS